MTKERAYFLDTHAWREVMPLPNKDGSPKPGAWYVREDWADAEIAQLRAALKVAKQSLTEFRHAQECGPSWYTRGEAGMYGQVSLWLRRGLEAVSEALGPYDENGEFLKEKK